MTTFFPLSTAGIRYASVLPVPVPASTSTVRSVASAPATARAMAACWSRGSKPGTTRASAPPDRHAASTASIHPSALEIDTVSDHGIFTSLIERNDVDGRGPATGQELGGSGARYRRRDGFYDPAPVQEPR